MIENPDTAGSPSEGVLIARGLLDRIIEEQMKESTAGLSSDEAHHAHLAICSEEIAHALGRFSKATGSTVDEAKFEWWPECTVKRVQLHVLEEDQ